MALRFKVAPLSGTFMITSMIGFLISAMYLSKIAAAASFAFSFSLLFAIMFIASIISMTYTPIESELAIDEPHEIRKRQKKVIAHHETKKQVIKKSLKGSVDKIKDSARLKKKPKRKTNVKLVTVKKNIKRKSKK